MPKLDVGVGDEFPAKEVREEVREEVRIWDHKVHQARPVLLQHERGIKALRRWYAQFYPAAPTGS